LRTRDPVRYNRIDRLRAVAIVDRALVAVIVEIGVILSLDEIAGLVALPSLAIAVELRRNRPLLDDEHARAVGASAAAALGRRGFLFAIGVTLARGHRTAFASLQNTTIAWARGSTIAG
jgi:hypothetical protein